MIERKLVNDLLTALADRGKPHRVHMLSPDRVVLAGVSETIRLQSRPDGRIDVAAGIAEFVASPHEIIDKVVCLVAGESPIAVCGRGNFGARSLRPR